MELSPAFDGVFRFTNATEEDFTGLWNNVEYTFPAKSTSPMIITGESLENIQEIRKKFAKKLAQREYHKSKDFLKIANGDGVSVPSMYNESVLQPWIDQCLEPLPVAQVKIKALPKDSDKNYKSKAVDTKSVLNEEFKDAPVEEKGEMSTVAPKLG